MKTKVINIVDSCIGAIKLDNRQLVNSAISKDVKLMFTPSPGDGESLLYVGKEMFFRSLDKIKNLFEQEELYKPNITWVIQNDSSMSQYVKFIYHPVLNRHFEYRIDYEVDNQEIKFIKIKLN